MPKQRKTETAKMVVTILGCGTSVGTPMIGQQHMRQFKNPKNWRMRASLLVEPFGRGGPAILIDTSPDFRMQAIKFFPQKNPRLDAILITHSHADHLHGLDDIRPFNFVQKTALPLYAAKDVCNDILQKFAYIFHPFQEGGGVPRVNLQTIAEKPFFLRDAAEPRLHGLEITPLPMMHGNLASLGYRIGNLAYVTDTSYIPDETIAKMAGLEVLILDCLRPRPHATHLTVEQATDYAKRIGAKKTIFTHMAYELDYETFRKQLPRGIVPAYDGLQIRL